MNTPTNNIPNAGKISRMSLLFIMCVVFMLSMMMTACGSGGDDDESGANGTTIEIDWEDDQIVVEVTSSTSAEDILTTPVSSLNESGAPPEGWTLKQIGIDIDGDETPDEVYAYEYDDNGYLVKKEHYSTVDDASGDPIGDPDEIVEYNVDDGELDEVSYDEDGDGIVDRIVDYDYDEGRIDEEEVWESSSKSGDPDKVWQYDYSTDEGAFLKELYIGDDDKVSEVVVYNSYGDTVKVSADPDASGVFGSVIEITPAYDHFDNIVSTTTRFDIGGAEDTQVVTYSYTYDSDNGNLLSYEADDGDSNTIDPVTYFIWEQS